MAVITKRNRNAMRVDVYHGYCDGGGCPVIGSVPNGATRSCIRAGC
jgi:hypothetical protein